MLDVDYLVKGMFVRREVGVIYGPTDCGKSPLISTIAMAVVRGESFAGSRTRRTAVLHIAPEGARVSKPPPSHISAPVLRTAPNST